MTRRWTIAVVGCGNIGSRHLQGLARLQHPCDIYGIEPSESKRAVSRKRVAEVAPERLVSFEFHEALDALPPRIDLAIVATAAAIRRDTVEALIAQRKVDALILEKFLFQRLIDYEEVGQLLASQNVLTWVNTPRRAWPGYQSLKNRIAGAGPFKLSVDIDEHHALATNAIHCIDLIDYLADSGSTLQVDGSNLSPSPYGSRHRGTIEFEGVLSARSDGGDRLIVRNPVEDAASMPMELATAVERIVVDEANQRIRFSSANGKNEEQFFPVVLQSTLTGDLAEGIISQGICSLPPYEVSSRLHRECLKAFLQALGQSRSDQMLVCPVT